MNEHIDSVKKQQKKLESAKKVDIDEDTFNKLYTEVPESSF